MKVFKEVKTKEVKILYTATLESGVNIEVYGDYALGSDSKTYYHVGYEDKDGDLHTLGWSCETDRAVILEK